MSLHPVLVASCCKQTAALRKATTSKSYYIVRTHSRHNRKDHQIVKWLNQQMHVWILCVYIYTYFQMHGCMANKHKKNTKQTTPNQRNKTKNHKSKQNKTRKTHNTSEHKTTHVYSMLSFELGNTKLLVLITSFKTPLQAQQLPCCNNWSWLPHEIPLKSGTKLAVSALERLTQHSSLGCMIETSIPFGMPCLKPETTCPPGIPQRIRDGIRCGFRRVNDPMEQRNPTDSPSWIPWGEHTRMRENHPPWERKKKECFFGLRIWEKTLKNDGFLVPKVVNQHAFFRLELNCQRRIS